MTEKSTTGLDANLAGALAYAGWWVTGLIFLVLEKDSRFVKYHALQSIIVFGGLSALWFIIWSLPLLWIVAFFISPLLMLAGFILWILLMVKAYNGEKFKMPIAGDYAEKQANQ